MNITKQALEMSVLLGVVAGIVPAAEAQQHIVLTMPKGMMTTEVPVGGVKDAAAVKRDAEAVQGMSFDRSPANLLQTFKKGQKLSDPEVLQMAVVLGDWPKVGQMLKGLNGEVGMGVYQKILAAISTQSASVDEYYSQQTNDGRGGRGNRESTSKSLLLPEDLYALIECAPGELKAEQIGVLSNLVKIAVTPDRKNEFLQRLSTGIHGIGGESVSGKLLAAQLLSQAGWITEAGRYLPLDRAGWDKADTMSMVLLLEYYTQKGVDERDERLFKQSAEVCAFLMSHSRLGGQNPELFRLAADRFVKLLPAMGDEAAEELVKNHICNEPEVMKLMIMAISEMGMKAQGGKDLAVRAQCLATQEVVMKVLDGMAGELPEQASLLVANWLAEAEVTYRSAMTPSLDPEGTGDMQVIVSNYYSSRQKGDEVVVVAPELILKHTPPDGLMKRMSVGLQQRVKLTFLKVHLMNPVEPETIQLLESYIAENPGKEKVLSEAYLSAWIRKRCMPAEDPNLAKMRKMGYNVNKPQDDKVGIPLTRLRQNQNIRDYQKLVEVLRGLSKGTLDSGMVVQGFVAIHSGAEVFKQSDIEAIFGKADQMATGELIQLVSTMRGKLLEQWQDAKVQQQQATNRTEKEMKDEVSKGYRACLDLLRYGMKEGDDNWKHQVVRAQIFFDAAEFELSRQVKLVDYVNLRDEAFASYRRAVEKYLKFAQGSARGQWTVEPFQMWFSAMLGASDLSHLTQLGARTDPGFDQIGDMMRGMPKEIGEWHLMQFGQSLQKSLVQVPANLRQPYLTAGLQVIGKESRYAQLVNKKLAEYEELLDEIRLGVVMDGVMKVGVGQSFGVFIRLDHTAQLARESGGFNKYLTNGSSGGPSGMGGQGAPPIAYRDLFIKNIHAALDPTFEVVSVTYYDPAVKSYDLEREGWKSMPLAYVVLKAKDAAVDRIPSMQMDMDFSDVGGRVVLPVRTPVVQLDASAGESGVRPCEGLQLEYAMDAREWEKDGQAVVEVVAHGNGLIADLDRLMDYQQDGMAVEVVDGGLVIRDVSSEDGKQVVNAERTWQLVYRRKSGAVGEARLKFPRLKDGLVAEQKHQVYQDADLVAVTGQDLKQGVLLPGAKSKGVGAWVWGLLLVLVGAVGWVLKRRSRSEDELGEAAQDAPLAMTPIAVVGYLRRIYRHKAEVLSETELAKLKAEIEAIEAANYSGTEYQVDEKALAEVVKRWQSHEVGKG